MGEQDCVEHGRLGSLECRSIERQVAVVEGDMAIRTSDWQTPGSKPDVPLQGRAAVGPLASAQGAGLRPGSLVAIG